MEWEATLCCPRAHMGNASIFAKVPDSRRTKLEAKAEKCVFLGYCKGTKACIEAHVGGDEEDPAIARCDLL